MFKIFTNINSKSRDGSRRKYSRKRKTAIQNISSPCHAYYSALLVSKSENEGENEKELAPNTRAHCCSFSKGLDFSKDTELWILLSTRTSDFRHH